MLSDLSFSKLFEWTSAHNSNASSKSQLPSGLSRCGGAVGDHVEKDDEHMHGHLRKTNFFFLDPGLRRDRKPNTPSNACGLNLRQPLWAPSWHYCCHLECLVHHWENTWPPFNLDPTLELVGPVDGAAARRRPCPSPTSRKQRTSLTLLAELERHTSYWDASQDWRGQCTLVLMLALVIY
jgi:hypothetical protein